MQQVGGFISWIGGAISRTAASAVIFGVVLVVFGMTPGQLAAYLMTDPPPWLASNYLRLAVLIVGLVIIAGTLTFNRWSQKQKAIDSLAEDISEAIHSLVNRKPVPATDDEVKKWTDDYLSWCARVSKKLENRAFFTRADQLHFDRLGYIDPVAMYGHATLDWWHSQLRHKFERLRDVINWTQERRR